MENEIIKREDMAIVNVLESSDPLAFDLYCEDLTVDVSIMKPSISQLLVGVEKRDILNTLMDIITRKLKQLGDKGNLSKEERAIIAIDFFSQRKSESIDDLILCLDMGRQGRFGKVFGKVDAMTVNLWMNQYMDIKYQKIEERHKRLKKEPIMNPDLASRLLNDMKSEEDEGRED